MHRNSSTGGTLTWTLRSSVDDFATEIPNDGIDQDCDGEDLVTIGLKENEGLSFSVVPNPLNGEMVVKLSSKFQYH